MVRTGSAGPFGADEGGGHEEAASASVSGEIFTNGICVNIPVASHHERLAIQRHMRQIVNLGTLTSERQAPAKCPLQRAGPLWLELTAP